MPILKKTSKGSETKIKILQAALQVLINNGFASLTIKSVADAAGIAQGNLTYYFANKEVLVREMLQYVISDYVDGLTGFLQTARWQGPDRFIQLAEWFIDDALSRKTSRTFIELWAMGNHDPEVARKVRQVYAKVIEALMLKLGVDPKSPSSQDLRAALYFFAVVTEGFSALFGDRGRGKPECQQARAIAVELLAPRLELGLKRAFTDNF